MFSSQKLTACAAVLWFATVPVFLRAEPAAGIVNSGHARFTVIAPTLIRMEYSADGKFVDLPSWFAVNRQVRDPSAKITVQDKGVEVDTGAIRLAYHDDGQPFSVDNLHAAIRKSGGEVGWEPGKVNTENLGGTLTTLDMIKKAVPLGDGLLARDGWYLLDDSHSPLFSGDWIAPRARAGSLDWYLFGYGLDYRAALRSFTAVSGPVPLPRKYTLGVWYSRYWPYTSDDFKRIVEEYEAHGYPLDVLVMDMDWHPVVTNLPNIGRGYANLVWTGYAWNKTLIPDPPELLRWMHDQGIAVTLNDHPADGIQPARKSTRSTCGRRGATPLRWRRFLSMQVTNTTWTSSTASPTCHASRREWTSGGSTGSRGVTPAAFPG